jgi:hypothetical protein
MKKLTATLLAVCFAASIVGCTEEKTTVKKTDSGSGTSTTTTTDKTK